MKIRKLQTHGESESAFSLIELLIGVVISGVMFAAIAFLLNTINGQSMAARASSAAYGEAINLMLHFRKVFMTKSVGDDVPCVVSGVNISVGAVEAGAYCVSDCTNKARHRNGLRRCAFTRYCPAAPLA